MRKQLALLLVLPPMMLATACANLTGTAGSPIGSQFLLPVAGPVRTTRENVDQYVCADEQPLVCECFGRFSSSTSCECRCPVGL